MRNGVYLIFVWLLLCCQSIYVIAHNICNQPVLLVIIFSTSLRFLLRNMLTHLVLASLYLLPDP